MSDYDDDLKTWGEYRPTETEDLHHAMMWIADQLCRAPDGQEQWAVRHGEFDKVLLKAVAEHVKAKRVNYFTIEETPDHFYLEPWEELNDWRCQQLREPPSPEILRKLSKDQQILVNYLWAKPKTIQQYEAWKNKTVNRDAIRKAIQRTNDILGEEKADFMLDLEGEILSVLTKKPQSPSAE